MTERKDNSHITSGSSFVEELDRRLTLPNFTFGDPEKDEEEFYIYLPYSDLRGWIYERETIGKAASIFPLWRLQEVRSLSFVSMTLEAQPNPLVALEQPQTRFSHTLVVARTMEAIMRNNDFDEQDIQTGIVAAMLHDIATPALGDATKKIDPANLDEEDWWWEVLDEGSWAYLESIGATREQIDDIIHNKGILGQVLDIADRIGYTMIDLERSGANIIPGIRPDIGNIFKDVRVDKETGRVYFEDYQRLGNFLYVRAWFFRNVYINPYNQGSDFLFLRLIEPFYRPDESEASGKLTPNLLRRMADQDLVKFLAERYTPGRPWYTFTKSVLWFPKFERFDSLEKAESRVQEISRGPDSKVIGIKEGQRFNPSLDYLTKNEDGEIVEYREAEPFQALLIHRKSESMRGFYVFYADSGDLDLVRYLP
ncbi:MAG: hypothetical protein UU21_C0003G0029 [Candidatus Levybacteria bacterium GW2011_GWA2_40_8]|nr:MAG: hypothetical protein UU21_C0003G0029 [Candidatus Levybacteria bacterium GW2011_GWA2_40_8]